MAFAACGSEAYLPADAELPDDAATLPLESPSLRLVSPPNLVAGAKVMVLGERFVTPSRGRTVLVFTGEFQGQSGVTRKVQTTIGTSHVNAGRVEFIFEPELPPEGFGYEVGTFYGEVTAVNVDDHDASPPSTPLEVALTVGPSLVVWKAAPAGASCEERRISRTTAGQEIVIDVEATGVAPSSPYAPLTFSATYADFAGEIQTVSVERIGTRRAQLVIDPGTLPPASVEESLIVNLGVDNGDGDSLARSLSFHVGLPYRVAYDGNVRIVELLAPVQVSSCLPGGANGRDVSYSGGQSESRSRSVGFSVNVGVSLWVVNAGFGLNVSQTLSTDTSESLSMSGRIFPGQYGVFYRQTQRLERLGQIEALSACGEKSIVGLARVTDWNWAPDLAITQNGSCPPAPPTNLPAAQVFP